MVIIFICPSIFCHYIYYFYIFQLRVTLIQSGWPFDELIDFTAVRLASLHTVVNPWLYPLTRRKYRDAFWYLLTLFAYYATCTLLVTRPGTALGKSEGRGGGTKPRLLSVTFVTPIEQDVHSRPLCVKSSLKKNTSKTVHKLISSCNS